MRVAVWHSVRRLASSLTLLTALGACSVDQVETAQSAPRVVNACETDADCRTEGANSSLCGPGMCVSTSGDVTTAYVEVVPSASSPFGAGDSFVLPLPEMTRARWDYALELPHYANVGGRVTTAAGVLGEPASEQCEQAFDAASETLQVHVELSRSEGSRGLPALSVAANAEYDVASGWFFKLDVPPGRYDVYATALSGCNEDFPPLLAPNQLFDPGTVQWDLHVGALSTLSGIVTPPSREGGHVSLAGWQVRLVEPTRGQVISTTRKLNDSNPTNFELRYQPIDEVTPMLELTPPEDVVAPKVIWDLSVLDLDGDGQVAPNLSSLDLSTVHVRARLVDANVEPVANVSVRLRSKHLLGASQGLSARFETVVESDGDGIISLDIMPGSYQVIATPPDPSNLAVTESSWEVARSPAEQAGKTVELTDKQTLNGVVVTPQGQPLRNGWVSLSPSMVQSAKYLDRVLNPAAVVPRSASGITNPLGEFEIPVDPGSYDLSVQPPEGSNFPWLVGPRVEAGDVALESLEATFPVPLAGTLSAPNGEFLIGGAILRVFAVLDRDEPTGIARSADAITGDGVLQIAEQRSDENGDFVLLLPSRLVRK